MLAWGGFPTPYKPLGGQPPARHAAPNPQPDYAISVHVSLNNLALKSDAVSSVTEHWSFSH
jgi:hypothetical protein